MSRKSQTVWIMRRREAISQVTNSGRDPVFTVPEQPQVWLHPMQWYSLERMKTIEHSRRNVYRIKLPV
jgi:hypothetical protein